MLKKITPLIAAVRTSATAVRTAAAPPTHKRPRIDRASPGREVLHEPLASRSSAMGGQHIVNILRWSVTGLRREPRPTCFAEPRNRPPRQGPACRGALRGERLADPRVVRPIAGCCTSGAGQYYEANTFACLRPEASWQGMAVAMHWFQGENE